MANQYKVYVDDVLQKTINLNANITGLSAGDHVIKVESYQGATLVATDIKNITVAGAVTFETETTAYMNAIAIPDDGTATIYTGLTGAQLWTLVDNYIKGLKTDGIWTKIVEEFLFIGGTAAKHAVSLKNPTTRQLTWYGGWTHNNLGSQGNGSNAYADTGLIPSAHLTLSSGGQTVISGTNNTPVKGDSAEVGSYVSGTQRLTASHRSNNIIAAAYSTAFTDNGTGDARGIITSSKINTTNVSVFKNGALRGTSASEGTIPTQPIFLSTLNFNGLPYGEGYSNQRRQGYSLHQGLTSSEVGAYHNRINALQAGLGRKTW